MKFLRMLLLAAVAVSATLTAGALEPPTAEAAGPSPTDWLGPVNAYRAQAGLSPIGANADWSAGAKAHSCWMLLNGISHDEAPGTPGYTSAGDAAGNSGNVAVSSNASATARRHIDLWMSGPFHAIGVLRPSLRTAGFGLCSSPPYPTNTQWRSAATLDVIRGNDWRAPRASTPIVFPGNGATTSLTRFIAESPDPRNYCGWSGRSVGLPLIALMPGNVSGASATLIGPNGPVPTCVLHKGNTSGIAQSILGGDDAVVVVPSAPLSTGAYRATVNSTGGNVNWSFNVDPTAALTGGSTPTPAPTPAPAETKKIGVSSKFTAIPATRLVDSRRGLGFGLLLANRQLRVKVAGVGGLPADITAISANFTVTGARGSGYLTASNCSASPGSVSTLNYQFGESVPNHSLVPLDNGYLCLFSTQQTEVVIDVTGYSSASSTEQFMPLASKRIFDSRRSTALVPGQVKKITVDGGSTSVPTSATAVAVNLTGVSPSTNGWVRAYPCDQPNGTISSLNPRIGSNRANSAIVATSAAGQICLVSNTSTHVIVDLAGWFGPVDQRKFQALNALRLADTRSSLSALNPARTSAALKPGKTLRIPVAGVRGVPDDARAASINITSVGGWGRGWVRATPCGSDGGVSNLNFNGPRAIANSANVKLDQDGAICITSNGYTHVVVDITGVWV